VTTRRAAPARDQNDDLFFWSIQKRKKLRANKSFILFLKKFTHPATDDPRAKPEGFGLKRVHLGKNQRRDG
jgi:hypothetical protein